MVARPRVGGGGVQRTRLGGSPMASPARSAPTRGWRRWIHPLHSVRVRITLAAVLVTAVAVGTAGWLLVHSVEDAQLGQLRHDINDSLDQVAARLEEGDDPQAAVEATRSLGFG